MKHTIKYCFENKKIGSFYCDLQNTEAHYTGYINAYNEREVVISHITPAGLYDGYILRRIEDFHRIDYDGSYEKKIEKLYQLRKQKHDQICFSEELFYSIVNYANENRSIVSIYFDDDYITGLISNYNDNCIFVNCINDDGQYNGVSSVLIDCISHIEIDTENEQNLSLLYFD